MSELEHYGDDLAAIEQEIVRCAQICGFDVTHAAEVEKLIHHAGEHPHNPDELHRQKMIGLLMLRAKLIGGHSSG